ncbi:MAG: type II CAAX endopeptidase family protein [Halobacteriales archaeon]|nr:type II CAAX endopeptidase family protein [Halobacteriales archaeon]
MSSEVNHTKVAEFLAVAFGVSWTSAVLVYVSGVEYGTLTSTALVVVFFMWAPAFAAVVVQMRRGESVRAGCGLFRGRLRWVAFAWLAPLALVVLTIAVGVIFPSISFSTDYTAFLTEAGLTDEQIEESLAVLDALPVPPVVLFVVQALVAGATINAAAALGEELGWRGLLLSELAPLGFWRLSAFTGVVWGVWHAPVVLQGHNFPDSPLVGVAVMTVWTVAVSPVFTYLTLRARSVLAATFFHGTFNASAGFSLLYLTGAGTVFVSPVGVVGIVAAVLATTACVVHDRHVATVSVTSGAPVPTWEDGN